MKISLSLKKNMTLIGKNSDDHHTYFDTHKELGGDDSAASPMEIMLQSLAACSSMDVISIIRKKRKTIDKFEVLADGERSDNHPKVFTDVKLVYKLWSPDATLQDLERAVELSQTTYCGAAAMFRASGCNLSYEVEVLN